ncbi:MAG: hypothetical protein WC464_07115 [Bdellovibrionales bacterium]
MKLSVVIPSHNIGPRINLNLLNASLMVAEDVEVIIRDNSGNQEKRDFLSGINEKNCRIICVDECSGSENYQALLNEACGEFIFTGSDDDVISGYSIPLLRPELDKIKDDPAIIGTTGIYIVENSDKSVITSFDTFDAPAALDRFKNFLDGGKPSIFQYSPIKRDVLMNVYGYMSSLPVELSFHDWLLNCLYLMHGRMTYKPLFLCQYINNNWSSPEQCLESDAKSWRRAGLDASGIRLQWLVCAFEGASAFLVKYRKAEMSEEERMHLALYWYNHWIPMLNMSASRQAEGARFDKQALSLIEKWKSSAQTSLPNLLDDVAEYFALSSPEIAQRYHDFWKW